MQQLQSRVGRSVRHLANSRTGVATSRRHIARGSTAGPGTAQLPSRIAGTQLRAYSPGSSYEPSAYPSAGPPSQFAGSSMMGRPGQQSQSAALANVDSGNAALKAKEQPKTVQVRFWLKFHVDYGQTIRLIGGHESMGAWNLSKAPFLKWSEGDLWNVTLELGAGGVYEYKYVVVESDGITAASWQRGANNVLALQMNDEEVEAYDNWKNAPGAIVLVDGNETTRERKLLAWAGDMTVQRSELRRTRMELAQAREEIRVLRAELSVLRMEVSEANIARAAAEARQLELERANSALRLEVTSSNATAKSTMEEAVRLLTSMGDDDTGSSGGYSSSSSSGTSASFQPAGVPSTSASASDYGSSGAGGANGNGGFGSLFNFQQKPGDGPAQVSGAPSNAASAVVAAAAAMAAATGNGYSRSSSSYSPGGGSGGAGGSGSEVVSASSTTS